MCGIFGSPTMTPSVKRMLPYLGIEMLSRGRDAWGASDGETLLKRKGPITETWAEFQEGIEEWKQGIFHTRGASTGTPKEEANAHPFEFWKDDGTSVIGIHNGYVANHSELNTLYGRDCAVDSEHLWAHRAEKLPWSDILGNGNLAWWETQQDKRRLNLCRFNADALRVAKLRNGEYIFCSTMGPISTIASMLGNPVDVWFQIEEYTHYWFEPEEGAPGGVRLWKGEKLEFARPQPKPIPTYTPHGSIGAGPREHWRANQTYCTKCNSTRVSDSEVLCYQCLRFYMELYEAEGAGDWVV